MNPTASVLIPTHNRAASLEISVGSVLAQSVAEVEVLIIGDGVTESVRSAATALAATDERVRFFDRPKSENHGEPYRHDAIVDARSNAIFYLCDDDLFMREHIADLLALLESHNFVQSLNGWISAAGDVGFYPANLALPETIAIHLQEDIRYNSVSITGTAHSRDFYLSANQPWTTTPLGEWPDHYQWRKLFRAAGFRGATSSRMTAIQLPTTGEDRAEWSDERRLEELRSWAAVAAAPHGQEQLDALCLQGAHRQLEFLSRSSTLSVLDHQQRFTKLQEEFTKLQEELTKRQEELTAMRASRSWRATRPFAAVLQRLRRPR